MNPQSMLIGALISFVVSGLKRIPIVCRYPKTTTAVLSVAVPAGVAMYGQITGHDVSSAHDLIAQVTAEAATQFTSAVATHETVTHMVNKVTGKADADDAPAGPPSEQ